jgi:hypothetical protein
VRGINRYFESLQKSLLRTGPCVFISHRSKNQDAASEIGDYLTSVLGVDIYIDSADDELARAVAAGDHAGIVRYIEKGIAVSTHLLGIIGTHSRGSWWVPFEIGAGRQRKLNIAYVLLDSVDDLPSYLRIAELIKDRIELGLWAKSLRRDLLEKSFVAPNITRLPRMRFAEPTFFHRP